jgi:hypothetical protein
VTKNRNEKAMSNRYYVPVFANWEGEAVVPSKPTNGTVAFYAPGFPPSDEWEDPKTVQLNATVPAFWIAIEAVTPLIYKSNYFVVLGVINNIVDGHVPGAGAVTAPKIPPVVAAAVPADKSVSFYSKIFSKFGPTYTLFGLGVFLYTVHRLRHY